MMVIITFFSYWHLFSLCIDVPLRDKSRNEVVCVLSKISKERLPETVCSDRDTEFLGHKVQSLFKSNLICHFVTQNEVKTNYAERAIKTIKGKINKYFTFKHSY